MEQSIREPQQIDDVRGTGNLPSRSSTGRGGRRRARIACVNCNSRKVRCNVAAIGPPCANCSLDYVDCQVVPRRRRSQAVYGSGTNVVGALASSSRHKISSQSPHPTNSNFEACSPQREDESEALDAAENASPSLVAPSHGGPIPISRAALSYTGDDAGTAGSLGELLNPVDSSQTSSFEAYLVPGPTAKKTPPEELEFLRVKGAFSTPPKDVCDEAVLAFFLNAHPLLPVLDAKSFLDQYSRRGCQGISLILLWSILHVAASFLPMETVRRSGFQTKKAMKFAMYRQVKLLYDNNQETDELALVQAVIILGYWHPNNQDRFEAWHWTGIAISMSQSMGLHRSSFGDKPRGPLPADRMRLARRIWWCCLVRDRWLAFIKGRPMRIDLEDCDMPLPSPSDVAEDLHAIPQHVKERCILYSPNVVGELWCKLVSLSILLGRILKLHTKNIWRTDAEKVVKYDAELQEYTALASFAQPSNPYEQFFACQVRLHHEAIVIVLFRPFVLSHPKDPADAVQSLYRTQATQKTRAAAKNMNNLLEQIMILELVEFISPTIITPLIAAMQIHLLDCRSSTGLISRLGHHSLQLCMMFHAELRDTYWGADRALRLFEQAQDRLSKIADREGERTTPLDVSMSQPIVTLTPTSNDFNQSGIIPLVDDILTFDFAFAEPPNLFMNGINCPDDGSSTLNSFLDLEEFNEFVETSQAAFTPSIQQQI